ncbi:hypothetical protein L0Y34_01945 [Candidatus Parcubacteria bacterium]|nr:hypothetical protein [Candidatus Parcubacteria bacterium]
MPICYALQSRKHSTSLADASIRTKGKEKMQAGYEDVNGDGFTDLVAHFDTQALALTTSQTKAELTAELENGERIRGEDSVHIVH